MFLRPTPEQGELTRPGLLCTIAPNPSNAVEAWLADQKEKNRTTAFGRFFFARFVLSPLFRGIALRMAEQENLCVVKSDVFIKGYL